MNLKEAVKKLHAAYGSMLEFHDTCLSYTIMQNACVEDKKESEILYSARIYQSCFMRLDYIVNARNTLETVQEILSRVQEDIERIRLYNREQAERYATFYRQLEMIMEVYS